MKKMNFKLLTGFVMLAAVILVGCFKEEIVVNDIATSTNQLKEELADFIGYSANVIEDTYIVVYKEGKVAKNVALETKPYMERQAIMKDEVKTTLTRNRVASEKVKHVYGSALKGFAVTLTKEEVQILRKDEQIDYIEEDQVFTVTMGGPPGGGGDGGSGGQVTPWGITRVGGAADGTGKRAWIIDSGIDLDHPDLNVNVGLSQSFLGGNQGSNPDDQNGHGTHVAGTVAAINNAVGVVGVAAGAEVVSVRVLDRKGSGSNSGVIAGVNYVAANAASGDAANMSLGGGVSSALDAAVAAAAGSCPFALAAGNESQPANNSSPARVNGNNIYTVASMTSSDGWSSFSNYGVNNNPVDVIAPGSSINSTWKSGGYNTISGTSMAAPHVCGILLLGNVGTNGSVNGPDGSYPVASH